MRFHFHILLFAILATIGADNAAWAAKEELVLTPSSKWIVNYSDDSCRLLRQFGSDEDKIFLVMDRFGPNDGLNLIFAGSPFKYDGSIRSMTVQFGSEEQPQTISFFAGDFGKGVPAIIQRGSTGLGPQSDTGDRNSASIGAPGAEKPKLFGAARYAAVTYILVSKPLRQPVRFETGAMLKPFAALSKCIDTLVSSWGVDAEKHKSMTKYAEPIGSPRSWILSQDYPKVALSAGGQAVVHVRLNIDDTGKVDGCHIQQSTRGEKFDQAVCRALLKRAKFKPALDLEGKPMASYWRNTVTFSIDP